jgi:energy-coupling factor transporter ATP-binding protein EcfA2
VILDELTGYFIGDQTARLWLMNNEGKVDRYLHRYKYWDRNAIKLMMFIKAPLLAMRAVQDSLISDDQKLERIKRDIAEARGLIYLIFGKKGGGKTATAWLLLELAHEAGRKCYIAGPPQETPKWCERVPDPSYTPEEGVVYIPEAAVQYSARTSMRVDQRDVLSVLPTFRHGGRVAIVESQHSRLLDVNFLRLGDRWVLKPEPLYHFDERNPIGIMLDILKPQNMHETLFFAGPWFTLIKNTPLPKCWSEDLSTPFKPITDEETALKYAAELFDQGYTLREVMRILNMRSFIRPFEWWREKVMMWIEPVPEKEEIEVAPAPERGQEQEPEVAEVAEKEDIITVRSRKELI